MQTQHYINDRAYREGIVNAIGGAGKVILTNVLDRGHKNGAERFELTSNAVIYVYNVRTNNLITILFPRVGQLYSRFGEDMLNTLSEQMLRDIKRKCREHQAAGYNEI